MEKKKVFGNWRIVIVELFLKESPYTILGQTLLLKFYENPPCFLHSSWVY